MVCFILFIGERNELRNSSDYCSTSHNSFLTMLVLKLFHIIEGGSHPTGKSNWRWSSEKDWWSISHQLFSPLDCAVYFKHEIHVTSKVESNRRWRRGYQPGTLKEKGIEGTSESAQSGQCKRWSGFGHWAVGCSPFQRSTSIFCCSFSISLTPPSFINSSYAFVPLHINSNSKPCNFTPFAI